MSTNIPKYREIEKEALPKRPSHEYQLTVHALSLHINPEHVIASNINIKETEQ